MDTSKDIGGGVRSGVSRGAQRGKISEEGDRKGNDWGPLVLREQVETLEQWSSYNNLS